MLWSRVYSGLTKQAVNVAPAGGGGGGRPIIAVKRINYSEVPTKLLERSQMVTKTGQPFAESDIHKLGP